MAITLNGSGTVNGITDITVATLLSVTSSTATTSATTGAAVVTGGLGVGGSVYAAGNMTGYSDERIKTNWRPLEDNFIEALSQVKCGIYDRTDVELTQVGVSAQSLQKVLPEAVTGNDILAVTYGNAALAAAVKLAERVVELEARLRALETK